MFLLARQAPAPRIWPLIIAMSTLLSLIYVAIIPPFQSPDEMTHIERAYLLMRGNIVLTSINGSASGGYIDEGLEAYMDLFYPRKRSAARTITQEDRASAQQIRWAEKDVFSTPVVAAYSFPLPYLPQAMGLLVGKQLHLSIDRSYRLARIMALLCATACIGLACAIWTPSAALLALLCLPMNVFLSATAVLDPMATALATLALATFARIAADRSTSAASLFPLHLVSVMLVCGCRAHMLPLLLLPFVACYFIEKNTHWKWACLAFISILAWTLITIKTTVYPPGEKHPDHLMRLLHFLSHPVELFHMIWATLSNPSRLQFYVLSFIGILGWLDTPLPKPLYLILACGLIVCIVSSCELKQIATQRLATAALVLVSLCSIFLIFFALLVQWTAADATSIDGIQGRYFTIPILSLIVGLTCACRPKGNMRFFLSHGLVIAMLCYSGYVTTNALLLRYYSV